MLSSWNLFFTWNERNDLPLITEDIEYFSLAIRRVYVLLGERFSAGKIGRCIAGDIYVCVCVDVCACLFVHGRFAGSEGQSLGADFFPRRSLVVSIKRTPHLE